MSDDTVVLSRDDAFESAIDLSSFVLEYANAYHSIAGQEDFMGKRRVLFSTLLLMMDGMGKLLSLVQECEKAAKADYQNVQLEGFNDLCENIKKASSVLSEELEQVRKAFKQIDKTKGNGSMRLFSKDASLCELTDAVLTFDAKETQRIQKHLPSEETMDIYASAIERNAQSAAEYVHELAKALGLWRESDVRPVLDHPDQKHSIRYGHKRQSRIVPP